MSVVRLGEWWYGYTIIRTQVVWNSETGEVIALLDGQNIPIGYTPSGKPEAIDLYLPKWQLEQAADGNVTWIWEKLNRFVASVEQVGRYFLRKTGGSLPPLTNDAQRAEQLWALGNGLVQRGCGKRLVDGRVIVYTKMLEAEVARSIDQCAVDRPETRGRGDGDACRFVPN